MNEPIGPPKTLSALCYASFAHLCGMIADELLVRRPGLMDEITALELSNTTKRQLTKLFGQTTGTNHRPANVSELLFDAYRELAISVRALYSPDGQATRSTFADFPEIVEDWLDLCNPTTTTTTQPALWFIKRVIEVSDAAGIAFSPTSTPSPNINGPAFSSFIPGRPGRAL